MRLLFSLVLAILTAGTSTAYADKIKVGVIVPLSGSAASMGQSLVGAVKLAATKNLALSFEDDQCEAKKALAAYHKLSRQGVRIFYLACSGSIMALAPLAKNAGQLIVTSYAGSAAIRSTGPEVIRFNPDAVSIAEGISSYLNDSSSIAGNYTLGLLYEEQDYAVSLADILEKNLGSRLLRKETYQPNSPSFKPQLLRLSHAAIDSIIFVPVGDGAARRILEEMRELNMKKVVLGEVNLCDYPFRPSDYGVPGLCFAATMQSEAFNQFKDNYRTANKQPSQYPFYDMIGADIFTALNNFAGSAQARETSIKSLQRYLLGGVKGRLLSYSFTPSGEVQEGWKYLQVVHFGEWQ